MLRRLLCLQLQPSLRSCEECACQLRSEAGTGAVYRSLGTTAASSLVTGAVCLARDSPRSVLLLHLST